MSIKYYIAGISWFVIIAGLIGCNDEEKAMTGIALNVESITTDVDVTSEVIPFPIPWDAEVLE